MAIKQSEFEKIYNGLKPKILNYITARVGSVEDAEDISSDVFMRVYKNLADFKWQGVTIDAWVYRIAKNAIIDHYRKRNKDKKRVDFDKASEKANDGEIDLLTGLLDDEEKKNLYVSISELSKQDQYLIYYKYFEELSLDEIAKRLKMSETNVGTKLHRLRKKLVKSINAKHNSLAKK